MSHFGIGSIWFRLESASFTDGMSKYHSFIRSESFRACVLLSRVILARGGNSLYCVWYRRAAGIAPIFQVIHTSIDHNFILNIHL